MPIYEYRCDRCEKEFEELVLGSNPEICCPKCQNTDVTKLLSTFSFKNDNNFSSSVGSSGCDTCSSSNCSSCH